MNTDINKFANATKEYKPESIEAINPLEEFINIPFPKDSFPDIIKEVGNCLNNSRGVPLEMGYFCALGIVAGMAGDKFKATNAAKDFIQFPNQFFIGVGESSAGKSIALEPLLNQIECKEAEIYKRYTEAKKNGTDATDPRFIVGNATAESLGIRMQSLGAPLFSVSPEGREVLSIIGGEYKKNGGAELSFYCKSWSGECYSADRVQRECIYIPRAMLSALWLIQPDIFARLTNHDESVRSGFIGRLFPFRASARLQYEPENEPETYDNSALIKWNGFILSLHENRLKGSIKTIPATSEARRAFRAYENKYVDIQNSIKEYATIVSKSREKACRLALIMAICNNADAIDENTARAACEITDYSNGILLDAYILGYKARAEERKERIIGIFEKRAMGRLPFSHFRQYARIEAKELEQAQSEYPSLFEIEKGNGKGLIFVYKGMEHN